MHRERDGEAIIIDAIVSMLLCILGHGVTGMFFPVSRPPSEVDKLEESRRKLEFQLREVNEELK